MGHFFSFLLVRWYLECHGNSNFFFLQAWLRCLCGYLLRSDLRTDWNVIVGLWENSAPSYLVAQWLSISVMQEDAERKRQ